MLFTLILFVALAVGVSFVCSILEAVILSCTPSYVESIRHTRPADFERIEKLHSNIEKPLAAILALNTFAHTVGATGAGAQAQIYFGNEWMTLFSVALTLAILFLSEILPKSMGARYWRELLPWASRILPRLVLVTYPLVVISQWMSQLFKGKSEEKVTRAEIQAFSDIGLNQGALSPMEYKIFRSVIELPQKVLSELMTPAEQVAGLMEDQSLDEAFDFTQKTPYSRLIVFGHNRDEIEGYILRDDILLAKALGKNCSLLDLLKPILRLPHQPNLRSVLVRMLKNDDHIAAVLDDQNHFVGIVSLEDLLEALIDQDIIDEMDRTDPRS